MTLTACARLPGGRALGSIRKPLIPGPELPDGGEGGGLSPIPELRSWHRNIRVKP